MSPATLIAFLIAIAIPIAAVYVIFALDLFGTGKRSTILLCLGWGAVGAFGLAYLLNSEVIKFAGYELTLTLLGPLIEELLKSAFLLFLVTQPRFHYFVDGAVYGFACGIGFAVTENLLYISTYPDAALSVSLSRVLSTSLMHATTSAVIGLLLGRVRRLQSSTKYLWGLSGFAAAIAIHVTFNTLVDHLSGTLLLLLGIGIGLGGAAVIGVLISHGLADEKKSFAETLGIAGSGVSRQERRVVQNLGGEAVENVLRELGARFGDDKVPTIRRLLITQANIGILQRNLNNPVSDRLRKAWQEEIDQKRAESKTLQKKLGANVMLFLRSVFPDDEATQNTFQREFAKTDPTQIHTFDMFMIVSAHSRTFSAEELSSRADLLSQTKLFAQVPLPDLENLSRAIIRRTFRDGELIFEQDASGDEMFVVTVGAIVVLSYDRATGTEMLLNVCQSGEIVGELTLLDGLKRSARARASGNVETLVLPRNQFLIFIQSRPQVIQALLRYVVGRARHMSQLVDNSIKWASAITQGKFDEAASQLAPAGVLQPAVQSAGESSLIKRIVQSDEPSAPEDTAILLHSVFSRMNGALEQKSKSAAAAAPSAKPSIGLFNRAAPAAGANGSASGRDSLTVLTPNQQLIVRYLQDGVSRVDEGATIQAIQSSLQGIGAIQTELEHLLKNGWIVANGSYYVLSPRHRRGSVALSQPAHPEPASPASDPQPTNAPPSGPDLAEPPSGGIFSQIKR